MTTASTPQRVKFGSPILLTLAVIACLAVIQVLGENATLPLATAAAVLVFCTRTRVLTTWEHLQRLYWTRISRVNY